MTDPPRARNALAERLLAGARRGTEPSAADEARVRAQLHGRVLSASFLLSAKSAHALTAWSKLSAAKVVLAFGLCGSTAVVAGVALNHGFGPETPAASNALLQPAATARPALAPSEPASASAASAPLAPVASAPLPATMQRRSASVALPAAPLSLQDMQLEIGGV